MPESFAVVLYFGTYTDRMERMSFQHPSFHYGNVKQVDKQFVVSKIKWLNIVENKGKQRLTSSTGTFGS